MFAVVDHQINSPNDFWRNSEDFINSLPENLKLVSIFKNLDGSRAVCLWDCDSLKSLKSFLEKDGSALSKNEYFEVDAQNSLGIPISRAAA